MMNPTQSKQTVPLWSRCGWAGENRVQEAPAELLRGRWLADNCLLLQSLCRRWLAGRKGKWPCLDHLVHDLLYCIQTTVISCSPAGEGSKERRSLFGVLTKMASLFTFWGKHQHDEPKPKQRKEGRGREGGRRGGGGGEEGDAEGAVPHGAARPW